MKRIVKPKGPGYEKHYLVVFPDLKETAKAHEMLAKDGPVHGVLCGDEPATVVSESQLRRLSNRGIRWAFADESEEQGENETKEKGRRKERTLLRTTAHRR